MDYLNAYSFYTSRTHLDRINYYQKIQSRYPDHIPVLLISDDLNLTHEKFIMPPDITVYKAITEFQKYISNEEEVDLLCNTTSFNRLCILSDVYQDHKASDQFLYLKINKKKPPQGIISTLTSYPGAALTTVRSKLNI